MSVPRVRHKFVNPRINSDLANVVTRSAPTDNPDELAGLHRLCREGRLYEVERWISEGMPLQVADALASRIATSALQIALTKPNHSLVLLLLSNGYDPNIEAEFPMDIALANRQWEFLEMLFEAGADPKLTDPYAVFDTYNSNIMERFRSLGLDLTKDHVLAHYLVDHTSNKPLFGFAKRHRSTNPAIQDDLNIALVHHAGKGNEKGALLCLWAGADPHVNVRDLNCLQHASDNDEDDSPGTSAVWEASFGGWASILRQLRPDPTRDDFAELYWAASDADVVRVLAKYVPPTNVEKALTWQIQKMSFEFNDTWRSMRTLETFFAVGARWQNGTSHEIADARRSLLKMEASRFVDIVKLLATGNNCSPHVLKELGRTPSMRKRMKEVGFIRPDETRDYYAQARPTRSRDVLTKFGILPSAKQKDTRSRQRAVSASVD